MLCWPLSAQAGGTQGRDSDAGAVSAIERLHVFFKNTRVIQADFQQSLMDARGNRVQEASGTLVMQRPGKFRWDYQKPYHQLIVADGKEITIYDEDLQQATIKAMTGVIGSTPASLLSGAQPLEANFNISEAAPKEGLEWVELTPKLPDSGFEHIRLGFHRDDLQVMEMLDSFGQTTSLRFTHMKYNIKPAPGSFAFTPPAGTDIVRETAQ
ncbi:MAG: outer membrane lipoprotein chaperone LolA [Gammaproteobacteria bacterium]|nr:outer membrane lipoprotein chaperone LolA [Gammaproteobacteria bacterium]